MTAGPVPPGPDLNSAGAPPATRAGSAAGPAGSDGTASTGAGSTGSGSTGSGSTGDFGGRPGRRYGGYPAGRPPRPLRQQARPVGYPRRPQRPPRVPAPPQRGWSRYSSRRWANIILIASAVVFVLAGVVGGFALRISSGVTERLVDRISPAYIQMQGLQVALLDQETGVRGYLLTGDPSSLQPYRAGRAAESAAVSRLRGLLDDPALVADLDRTERLADRWRQVFAEPAVAAAGQSDPAAAPELSQRGKEAFDELRSAVTGMQRHLADTRQRTRAEVASIEGWRDVIFLIILAAFLITGALLSLWLRRAIIRPVQDLGSTTRRVANEDFGQRIAVRGPTDVVELGADVESLRQRIVTELANAVEAHRMVEAQAEELRRSNAELEQFAYVASHDLQEPLRKVSSFCQMLERRYDDQLDDRGRQYIRFAVDAAKRMQVLINDLLTFSRVGRLNDSIGPVDLERSLAEALANLSTRLEENDADVTHDPLPTVLGDRTLLTMLLQNLVGNAVKFRALDRPPVIRLSAERDGELWRLAVEDNGIGVDPQFADKIFVIFQRLHTRDEYSGTGIGLALCKKIVEFHGGQIWLDPDHTDGTRIVFTLPAVVDADPVPEDAAQGTPTGDETVGEPRPDPQGATAP